MINIDDPRYPLLDQATPLRPLRRIEARYRKGLFVKRDDHMEIALGGNKLRSLEFWLGAALAEEADVLLVAGAPVSNQCRLTAAAAAIAGIDCLVIHNSTMNEQSLQASFLSRLYGAETRFIGEMSEISRGQLVDQAAEDLRRRGRRPYIVGDAVVGALGYVLAAEELHEQSRQNGLDIRHVILPGSMGPTEAGFIFGNALLGNPFQVHLVSVEYGQAELAARVARIYRDLRTHTELPVSEFDDLGVNYHMDFLGAGYGMATPESEAAIIEFARSEGILLEHTYTGKTFAGFLDLVGCGMIPAGEAACVVHTGGVPTLLAQSALFKSLSGHRLN